MINVTKTFFPPKEHFLKYVDRIYQSGWMTNNGTILNELEKRLCDYLGVENLVLVSNGTLALQIAYKVLGIQGSVVTTPFSFVATTSSLVWEKHKPVFADIDPETFNIDPDEVLKVLDKNTGAVLPVHVFGNPCDVVSLEEMCQERKIKLIFDAAHAFGIQYQGKSILKYGDASILSFHATKVFHTIEGGAIVFKDPADCQLARLMINFGISTYDKVDVVGINCKMNEFQAAMGMCVLDEMDSILQKRKLVWEKYYEAFKGNKHIDLQKWQTETNLNFSYFPVALKDENITLNIKSILNHEGIYPRRYFYPSLNKLTYLSSSAECKYSESLASRILCLPIYPDLPEDIQEHIIDVIIKNSD